MRTTAIAVLLLGLGLTGCADLTRSEPIRVTKDSSVSGEQPGSVLLNTNLVPVPAGDGTKRLLPRMNADGSAIYDGTDDRPAAADPPSQGG